MRKVKKAACVLMILLLFPAGAGAYWLWVMANYQKPEVTRDIEAHFSALEYDSVSLTIETADADTSASKAPVHETAKSTRMTNRRQNQRISKNAKRNNNPGAKARGKFPRQTIKGVTQLGAISYVISNALFQHANAHKDQYAVGVYAELATADDEPIGFTLTGVSPGSHLHAIGLRNGDTLTAINGHQLNTAKNVSLILASARYETHFRIDLIRNSKPINFYYKIL